MISGISTMCEQSENSLAYKKKQYLKEMITEMSQKSITTRCNACTKYCCWKLTVLNTVKSYFSEFVQLLVALRDVNVDSLTPERLRSYMLYCTKELKLSENTLNCRMNAIKFFILSRCWRKRNCFLTKFLVPNTKYTDLKCWVERRFNGFSNRLIIKSICWFSYWAMIWACELVKSLILKFLISTASVCWCISKTLKVKRSLCAATRKCFRKYSKLFHRISS